MSRILLTHMDFYGYDTEISKKFESMGYIVDMFHDELKKTLFSRILKRVFPRSVIAEKRSKKYQLEFLKDKKDRNIKYDFLVVIVGRYLCEEFYMELKKRNPNIVVKMYLWDDVARVNNFKQIQKYLDEIYSIDLKDCNDRNFEFLPLFYLDEFLVERDNLKNLDIYFSGLDHSNRATYIKYIIRNYPKLKYKFHLYSSILIRILYRLRHFDFSSSKEFISFKKIDLYDNIEFTKSAKCLIDIQYSSQNGLSIRTFESLASKSKLITTNKAIKQYDFYHPNNIKIIERDDICLDINFIHEPYVEIDSNIVRSYSLSNWAKKLMSDRNEGHIYETDIEKN